MIPIVTEAAMPSGERENGQGGMKKKLKGRENSQ